MNDLKPSDDYAEECVWISPNSIQCPHEPTLAYTPATAEDIADEVRPWTLVCSEHAGEMVEKTLSVSSKYQPSMTLVSLGSWREIVAR